MHQSCHSCIIQHLMSVKLCFYCKTLITSVKKLDGTVLYVNELSPTGSRVSRDTQTSEPEVDPEPEPDEVASN